MRTTTLVTSYIQAVLFLALGVRCLSAWLKQRERRSAHLALATGLYGINQLISAINTTAFDSAKGQAPPRWDSAISGIILYAAVFAFLLFLSNFVNWRGWLLGFFGLVTVVNMVLSVLMDPKKQAKVDIKHGIVQFSAYIWYVLGYLALVFAILAVSFLVYGFRTSGLARFRMTSIGIGFGLFTLLIGLIPLLQIWKNNQAAFNNLLNVIRYVAIAIAPLLLVGFSPPSFITKRFSRSESPAV